MDREEIKNAHRLDQFEDIMEKKVRTERHLEKYGDWSNNEQKEHAKEIQHEREERLEDLKDKIVFGVKQTPDQELNSIKRNYEFTKNYLHENADHLDADTVNNTKEKQEHRKEQIKFHEENKNEH